MSQSWDTIDDDQILNEYKVLQKLGRGAYGVVWKATSKISQEVVAIKKCFDAFHSSSDAQRIYREIMLLLELDGREQVVGLLDVVLAENDDDVYLVFGYMASDLQSAIQRGILQEVHKSYVTYQLFRALAYLHSAGVIHRDVKPQNILLDAKGTALLCDFGFARTLPVEETEPASSELTDYVATRWYRAPEGLLKVRAYAEGFDIWGAGCVVGELLRGRPLFPGITTTDQLGMIMELVGWPSDEDLHGIMSSYVERMLESLPGMRSRPPPRPLQEILPSAGAEALQLVSLCLHFNARKRISARDALRHPYVASFQDPAGEASFGRRLDIGDPYKLTAREYREKLKGAISLKKAEVRERRGAHAPGASPTATAAEFAGSAPAAAAPAATGDIAGSASSIGIFGGAASDAVVDFSPAATGISISGGTALAGGDAGPLSIAAAQARRCMPEAVGVTPIGGIRHEGTAAVLFSFCENAVALAHKLFLWADRNHNGVIDRSEFRRIHVIFSCHLADSNSLLADVQSCLDSCGVEVGAGSSDGTFNDFQAVDLNSNQVIDEGEWMHYMAALFEVLGAARFLELRFVLAIPNAGLPDEHRPGPPGRLFAFRPKPRISFADCNMAVCQSHRLYQLVHGARPGELPTVPWSDFERLVANPEVRFFCAAVALPGHHLIAGADLEEGDSLSSPIPDWLRQPDEALWMSEMAHIFEKIGSHQFLHRIDQILDVLVVCVDDGLVSTSGLSARSSLLSPHPPAFDLSATLGRSQHISLQAAFSRTIF